MYSPVSFPLPGIPYLLKWPKWDSLHLVSHQHPSAITSHQTDGFLSKDLLPAQKGRAGLPRVKICPVFLIPFVPNTWPFSRERQVTAGNDLLGMGVWWQWRKPVSNRLALPLGGKCPELWMQKDLVSKLRAFSTLGTSAHPVKPNSVWLLPFPFSFPERTHSPLAHLHMAGIPACTSWGWSRDFSDASCLTFIGGTQ